ncbi:MAG: hypothetical protein AAF823_12605 [Planctomycetota bacterium]
MSSRQGPPPPSPRSNATDTEDTPHPIADPAAASRRGAGYLLAGQAAMAASQIVLVLLIARLGGDTDAGRFLLLLGIATPTFAIANGGLRIIASADIRRELRTPHLLRLRIIGITLAAPLCLTVGAVALGPATAPLACAVVTMKCVEAMSDLAYGFGQRDRRFRTIALGMTLRAVIGLTAASALLLAGLDTTWAVVGVVAASAAVFLSVEARLLQSPTHATPPARPKPILRRAIALGVMSAFGALFIYTPIYILGTFSLAQAGTFGATQQLALGFTLLAAAWGHAHTSRYAELADHPRQLLVEIAKGAFIVAAPALLAAGVALTHGRLFLDLAFGPDFNATPATLAWLCAATAAINLASLTIYACVAVTRDWCAPLVHLAGVTSCVALGLAFYPTFGTQGIAAAYLLAALAAAAVGVASILLPLANRPLAGHPREAST